MSVKAIGWLAVIVEFGALAASVVISGHYGHPWLGLGCYCLGIANMGATQVRKAASGKGDEA